jgi:hypothetical protein
VDQKLETQLNDFLNAELRLARTFLNIASEATDKAKIDRNLSRAWKAHDAAAHFLKLMQLTKAHAEFHSKIMQLERDLRALEKSLAVAMAAEQLRSIYTAKKPRSKK